MENVVSGHKLRCFMLISEARLLYSNLSVSYIGSAGETRHDGTTRH